MVNNEGMRSIIETIPTIRWRKRVTRTFGMSPVVPVLEYLAIVIEDGVRREEWKTVPTVYK